MNFISKLQLKKKKLAHAYFGRRVFRREIRHS